MRLKRISHGLAAVITSAFILTAYTNCARSTGETSSSSTAPESNQSSQMATDKIDMAGGGIMKNWSTGCKAGTFTDWVETIHSDAKRVQPRDCMKMNVSTPVFVWPQPRDLMAGTGYSLHIFGTSNAYDNSLYPKIPRVLMPKAMPAGTYKWTVTYKTTAGVVITSGARQFEIPAGNLFAIPTGAQVANAVLAKSHPRIQPNEGTDPNNKVPWSTIIDRNRSRGYAAAFNYYFLNQLNISVGTTLPATPVSRNKMLDFKAAIVDMAYGYHLWNDVNYFLKAKPLLEGMLVWPLHCAIDDASDDQVNREIHSIIAISLDLFQDKLSEPAYVPLRNQMVSVLLQRLNLVNFDSLNTYPYDSHLITNAFYSLESMMYAAGTPGLDTDGGRQRIQSLWENAATSIGTWGSNVDAGWANSGGYGWYAADDYVRLLVDSKLMANMDLTAWPSVGNFGYNQLYFTAPLESIRQQFGDEADITSHYQSYSKDTFRLYALGTGKPEYEWYWRVRGDVSVNDRFMWNPLHFMLVSSTATAPTFPSWSPSSLAPSILFDEAGLVAMHSDMGNPNRTSVFFRSSPFGSFNHSHADSNAFTFVSKGKDMLISAGVYDSYGTANHLNVTRATRFKNALTFDGGIGQAEPSENPVAGKPGAPILGLLDFGGKVINFQDDGTWAVATGDAKDAYRGMDLNIGRAVPLLSSADRTVAYNRKLGVVLVYDWARSNTPRHWELNFHTLKSNAPMLFGAGQNIKLANATTSACLKVWTEAPYYYDAFAEGWEGYQPNPNIGRPIVPEVHMRFNVRTSTQEFTSVTVINEDCKDIPINVSFLGSAAYVNINGSLINFDGPVVKTP